MEVPSDVGRDGALGSYFFSILTPFGPDVDAHAFRLFAILVDFVAHYSDNDHQGPNDEKKNIAASHGIPR